MPRAARVAPGGMVFHVLNRAIARVRIFEKDEDFAAFERTLAETLRQRPMRICSYCLMPNHWHFLLWPERDGQLAAFMQRLTIAHVRKWQEHRRVIGTGHLYQGRYKSFPVEEDEHFLAVARTWKATRSVLGWCRGRRTGHGAVCGSGAGTPSRRLFRCRHGRRRHLPLEFRDTILIFTRWEGFDKFLAW